MLAVLGNAVVHYRKWILVAGVIGFVYAGAVGGGVAKHLSSGGFDEGGSESSQASDALERTFNTGEPNFILLVTAKRGTVDSPDVARRGKELTARLAGEKSVFQAASYWSLGSAPPLRSKDGRQAMVLARVAGTQDHVKDVVERLSPAYTASGDDVVSVGVGGFGEVFRQVGTQIERDLAKAEGLTLPLVLILLIFVFGSVVAAGLPVVIGAFAVVGTFLILRVMASLTEVSIFSLNLATGMGLGLAVDYALFVVSRYREELRNGLPTYPAIIRTIETAGRTVVFSAVTVAASLSAMLIFPLSFLRSFTYAGIGVVVLATLGAVVFLPALLAVLGPRIDKFAIRRKPPKPVGEGLWHTVATAVMRRPIVIGGAVIALLLFLGAPFLGAKFGLPDDRVLPKGASSRAVSQQLRENFDGQEAGALTVVAEKIGFSEAKKAEVDRYARALAALPNVQRVDAVTGFYQGTRHAPPDPVSLRFASTDGTWFNVVPKVDPMSDAARDLVRDVRSLARPFPVVVGGPSAELVDSEKAIFGRMPLAAALIGVITFVVLFFFTGSILVPVKALVLNILSLSATFGAMVWIFQEGHLSGLLGFTPTGNLDTTTPILMFCVAFGLSMDYEVFLLSRIKEEYDRTGDNVQSVAVGLERTGRLVTAAAGLLALVFIAFATSQITFIKLFGVGLALAIVMDATLVRGALVPAFMRLAGRANWWAPKPLRRFHDRYGLREADGPPILPRPERAGEPVPDLVGAAGR